MNPLTVSYWGFLDLPFLSYGMVRHLIFVNSVRILVTLPLLVSISLHMH